MGSWHLARVQCERQHLHFGAIFSRSGRCVCWRGDIELQTRQTLDNLDRVLAEFGVTKSNLAYVEIYLTHAEEHFDPVIRLFKEYVGEHRPAGSLIGVTYLASPEQWVEIRAVAHTD